MLALGRTGTCSPRCRSLTTASMLLAARAFQCTFQEDQTLIEYRANSSDTACAKKGFIGNQVRMACSERVNDSARRKCISDQAPRFLDCACLLVFDSFEHRL